MTSPATFETPEEPRRDFDPRKPEVQLSNLTCVKFYSLASGTPYWYTVLVYSTVYSTGVQYWCTFEYPSWANFAVLLWTVPPIFNY